MYIIHIIGLNRPLYVRGSRDQFEHSACNDISFVLSVLTEHRHTHRHTHLTRTEAHYSVLITHSGCHSESITTIVHIIQHGFYVLYTMGEIALY